MKTSLKRKFFIALSTIIGYLGVESILISTNLSAVLEVKKNHAVVTSEYLERHRVFYILQKPDPKIGFIPVSEAMPSSEGNPIDEYGFRNKQGDKERAQIAVVGDSFTFAYGVDYDYSWTKRLATSLGVVVSNFGVYAYSPWQYNQVIKRFPQFFKERMILYAIYANDFTDATRNAEDYYTLSGRERFKHPSPSLEELVASKNKTFWHRTAAYSLYRQIFTPIGKVAKVRGSEFISYGGNEFRRGWISNKNLNRICHDLDEAEVMAKRYAAKIIFILFPSKIRVYQKEYSAHFGDRVAIDLEEKAYGRITQCIRHHGSNIIDLYPGLVETAKQTNPYFKYDAHLNVHGNAVSAKKIAEYLLNAGYF